MAARSEAEIDQLMADELPDGADPSDGRNSTPGMTYEQGVEAALLWAAGHTDTPPLE